jgi:TonB family protein
MRIRTGIASLLLAYPALCGEWFPTRMQSADYPILANQASIEGTVKLRLTLSQRGEVIQATVLSGNTVLARSARTNMQVWQFAFPCSGEAKAPSTIDFTYKFELHGVTLGKPSTSFRYEHPYKVVVASQAQHWTPDSRGR